MNIIALITLIVLLFFVIRGAFRGFSGEMANVVGLAACIGTFWFAYQPVNKSLSYIPQIAPEATGFYATLIVFIVGAVLFFVISKIVNRIGALIIPQPFNAILGAIAGGAKAILFISIVAGSVMAIRDHIKKPDGLEASVPPLKTIFKSWDDKSWDDVILKGLKQVPESEQADNGEH